MVQKCVKTTPKSQLRSIRKLRTPQTCQTPLPLGTCCGKAYMANFTRSLDAGPTFLVLGSLAHDQISWSIAARILLAQLSRKQWNTAQRGLMYVQHCSTMFGMMKIFVGGSTTRLLVSSLLIPYFFLLQSVTTSESFANSEIAGIPFSTKPEVTSVPFFQNQGCQNQYKVRCLNYTEVGLSTP